MARDGYRIFDSDTHVGPDARILAGYLSEAEKERLRGWEAYKSQGRSGHVTYTKGQRRYRRRLGTAETDEAPGGYMAASSNLRTLRCPCARGVYEWRSSRCREPLPACRTLFSSYERCQRSSSAPCHAPHRAGRSPNRDGGGGIFRDGWSGACLAQRATALFRLINFRCRFSS
jgi:hypothetical protein